MCKCVSIDEVIEGKKVEDIPELSPFLKEVRTDFKTWETEYECSDCCTKWLEKYESKGHGDVPIVKKM